MKSMMQKIYFFQGGIEAIQCESYTTVEEVKALLMAKLKIDKKYFNHYALYEVIETEKDFQERFLENTERLLDVVAQWENKRSILKTKYDNSYKKVQVKEEFFADMKIFLKVRVMYDCPEDDK